MLSNIKSLIFVLLCVFRLSAAADAALSWDATLDWSRTTNPNGPWSYRNGNINSAYFGELAVSDVGPCGNNWVDGRNMEPFNAVDGCFPVAVYEFQSHGPFLCRWTSSFNGKVKVHGTLWQINETSRQMRFLLRHNGAFVTEVAAARSGGYTLLGSQYKVTLTDSGGSPDIEVIVAAGDTIDCILDGNGPEGNGVSTAVGCHFDIETIEQYPTEHSELWFDGAGDYVNMTDYTGIIGTNSRTIAAWIRTDKPGTIAAWGADGTGQRWIFMTDDPAGVIRVSLGSGYVRGTTNLLDDRCHYVAAVLQDDGSATAGEIKLYVDGKEENTTYAEVAVNTANSVDLRIGSSDLIVASDNDFEGFIGDVRLYDRALNATEITELYNGTDITTNLVNHWNLDEGYGTIANDSVGGYDGVINGDLVWTENLLCAPVPTFIEADVNRDLCVDMKDVLELAQQWLRTDCDLPYYCSGSDINKDRNVNLIDFASIALNWTNCLGDLYNLDFVVISPIQVYSEGLAWCATTFTITQGGTVWNAGLDYQDTNPAGNPNGAWSYRNSSGTLLPYTSTGIYGQPGWGSTGTGIFGNEYHGIFDPEICTLGAKYRWTSPVADTITIDGTYYQFGWSDRVNHWVLYYNGTEISRGYTPQTPEGEPRAARDYAYSLAEGSGGTQSLVIDVNIGDTIELLTTGTPKEELPIPWTAEVGDFGPGTPPTTTSSGFQEAIFYAMAYHKDIFVRRRMEYDSQTTIYFPPLVNFRLMSGNYLLRIFLTSGTCMRFDSLENCEFQLGMMGTNYSTPLTASVMKIKPQLPTPNGLVGTINNTFFSSNLGGGGWGWGGMPSYGTGLHLDGSQGPINCNKMMVMELIGLDTAVLLDQGEIRGNLIESLFNHLNNNMLVVRSGSFNRINMLFSGGGDIGQIIAADFQGGSENLCRFNYDVTFDQHLIFGPNAQDNLIYAMDLPANSITNNAVVPSNRVIPVEPVGFGVTTPAFPTSNTNLENRSSHLVVAVITSAGNVSNWTQTDASGLSQTINAGLYKGQLIYLEPGEKVRFIYNQTPAWRWKALR